MKSNLRCMGSGIRFGEFLECQANISEFCSLEQTCSRPHEIVPYKGLRIVVQLESLGSIIHFVSFMV